MIQVSEEAKYIKMLQNHKQGAEKVRETKELIKIFNKLSEENKKKFMVVLNLLAKEETSRTAQAVSSSLQTENR